MDLFVEAWGLLYTNFIKGVVVRINTLLIFTFQLQSFKLLFFDFYLISSSKGI